MALFYRKGCYLTGLFPRKGGLIVRNVALDSLRGKVALNGGKPASGARNIQARKAPHIRMPVSSTKEWTFTPKRFRTVL